jgi:hypothetical protein
VRPYLESTRHKKSASGMAQSTGPEFKPQYHKKIYKKKKMKKTKIFCSWACVIWQRIHLDAILKYDGS